MAYITDYKGKRHSGALHPIPAPWQGVNIRGGGFAQYEARFGNAHGIVAPHYRGGWEWSLYINGSLVGSSVYNLPTALKGVRAVQKAAARHGYEGKL